MKLILFILTISLFSCTQKETKQSEVLSNEETAAKTGDSLIAKPPVGDTEALPPPAQNNANKKFVKLGNPEFTFGDIGHLSFKDQSTRKVEEYEWVGELPAIEEIITKCNGHEGCPALKNQTYNATMEYRLMDIEDWDGEQMKPTGKKEKRWVIVGLEKLK